MPSLRTRVQYDQHKQDEEIAEVKEDVANVTTGTGDVAQDLADLEQVLRDGGVIP